MSAVYAGSEAQSALDPDRDGPIAYGVAMGTPNSTRPVCDAGTGCIDGEFVGRVGEKVGARPSGNGAYDGLAVVGGVGAPGVGDAVSGLKNVGDAVFGDGVGLVVGTVANCSRHPHKTYELSAGSEGALQNPGLANQSGATVVLPYVTPAAAPTNEGGNVQS